MDKEVTSIVNLSVALIALSVVLSIVMFTVFIGHDMQGMVVDTSVQLQEDTSCGELDSIYGGDPKIIPKAAIYYILSKEYNGIKELTYNGSTYKTNRKGLWSLNGSNYSTPQYSFPEDVLNKTTVAGKVSVAVTRVDRGQYKVAITDIPPNNLD